jgi:hypothetical protein
MIIEALAQWVGSLKCVAKVRRGRANKFIEAIAAEQGLFSRELMCQIEY